MQVTFCGTASGAFTAVRAGSGIVLAHDGRVLMLDCGPGALQGAMRAGIAPQTIEAVVLSHVHLDHVLDLAAFVLLQRFGGWPLPPVYGPPGTAGVTGAATGFVAATPLPRPTALATTVEIAGSDERDIGGFRVRSEETPHAPEVIAAARRLMAGEKTVVYSGDTQPNPGLFVPLADGADLLIHECYSDERLPEAVRRGRFTSGHTEVLEAAAIAREASVRCLALTHVPAWDDPELLRAKAASIFTGDIVVARDRSSPAPVAPAPSLAHTSAVALTCPPAIMQC